MRKDEFPDFCQMLDDTYALLARGNMPSATAKAMFFRSLSAHSLDAVRAGFDAHVKDPQRGKFAPVPADIVAQIEGLIADDGRPGPEEAWAMCARAHDEAETVVWSAEMGQAWQIATPIMQTGDEVGSRMAFKESYNRLVDDARRARRPVEWTVSLGHDPQRRQIALQRAETAGLIPHEDVLRLAPPAGDLKQTAALLIEHSKSSDIGPDEIKRRAQALKALLMMKTEPFDKAKAGREEIEAKKRATQLAVDAYEGREQA